MKIILHELANSLEKKCYKDNSENSISKIDKVSFEKLKKQLKNGELILPDDTIQNAVRSAIERDFLNDDNSHIKFKAAPYDKEQGWFRITRLPISPSNDKEYALYPRWQNTIAAMHTLQHRLCYILLREDGETKIYLGAIPTEKGIKGKDAEEQFMQAISSQMPGIGVETINDNIAFSLQGLTCCGCVTGIPSIRKMTQYGEYQTMDQIAMGLRNHGEEQDFAVVIVANPVNDSEIVETLRAMENLGSEIHALTQYTKMDGINSGSSISFSYTSGTSAGVNVGGSIGLGKKLSTIITGSISGGANAGKFQSESAVKGANVGQSESISQQYINKSAMYCEELFDKHIARIKSGRSMGFWKTGVYVLSDSWKNVKTIMGMLRAVYSGDDTYIEPIRTTMMPIGSEADSTVRMFQHLSFSRPFIRDTFGKLYEDYTTPMTTEELSITTSLPRRDVPGLRLIRNASRFATNPPRVKEKKEGGCPVKLGEVLDTGAKTYQEYRLDLNQLVRHTLVAGTNGSGKTNTCKFLLSRVLKEQIPFLVIEPTKEEYLDWALSWNEKNKNKKQILVFAPGAFLKEGLTPLELNPFQPAAVQGGAINMLGHLDRLKSALLSSLPMSDVLPLIMEETIFEYVEAEMNVKDVSFVKKGSPLDGPYRDDGKIDYPLVKDMGKIGRRIVEGRKYDKEVEKNISAAIETRIKALLLGWKEKLFNVPRSTDFAQLFENHNVVINLSYLTDDRDKALVMSILLIALWEYRISKYETDERYKKEANANKLKHLTLLEEAHRLMPNFSEDVNGGQNPQINASKMFSNMLSEIRAYSEGMIIVDQVPTRLIPDAVKNTNLKIIHRLVASDDIKAVSTGMMLRPDQENVIGALQQGEAIVCSDFDDAAAWVKVDLADEK